MRWLDPGSDSVDSEEQVSACGQGEWVVDPLRLSTPQTQNAAKDRGTFRNDSEQYGASWSARGHPQNRSKRKAFRDLVEQQDTQNRFGCVMGGGRTDGHHSPAIDKRVDSCCADQWGGKPVAVGARRANWQAKAIEEPEEKITEYRRHQGHGPADCIRGFGNKGE